MDLDRIKQAIFRGDVKVVYEFIDNEDFLNKAVNGEPCAFYEVLASAIITNRPRLILDNVDEIYDDLTLRLIKAAKKAHFGMFNRSTILCCALDNLRSLEIIDALIKGGSDVNASLNYMTPLMNALCVGNDVDIIILLVNQGADVNCCDEYGRTPLFYGMSYYYNRPDFIALLLEAGLNVHGLDNEGRNVFMIENCHCRSKKHCKIKGSIDVLLKFGMDSTDLKHVDNKGNTVLHVTSCKYVCDLAIKSGISIEAKNLKGQTPLLYWFFAEMPYKEKLVYLLTSGADIHSTDSKLQTALHLCVSKMCYGIEQSAFNILMYHGGNLYARNIYDQTVLDLIIKNDTNDLKYVILKHMCLFEDDGCDDRKIFLEKLNNSAKVNSHINACKREVNLMRKVFIPDGVTFYEFCILKRYYRSKCVNISPKGYKFCYSEIKKLFPKYRHLINIRIKDNHLKKLKMDFRKLFEKIILSPVNTSETDFHDVLNYDCLYRISKYLNYTEMFNIFSAAIKS